MEQKINIAELLKDCPKGMELDCTICNGVKFIELDKNPNYPIVVRANNGYEFSLTKYGQVHNIDDAKCIIFPKGKTTWEGFQRPFMEGDVVATKDGLWIGITTGGKSGESIPTYCVTTGTGGFEAYFNYREKWKFQRLATEEEKQKLFGAIKANGYKWNEETKTLEKLVNPKFKVGDKIRHDDGGLIYTIDGIYGSIYGVKELDFGIPIAEQDDWELVSNKFDINTLKPFDNCRYSLDGGRTWKFAQYWYIQAKYDVNEIEIDLWLN